MENHVKGLHHLGMRCANFEKTLKLYTEGLGMKIAYEWDGDHAVLLDMGDGCLIEMFEKGGEDLNPEGKWCRLALATDDIQASYDRAIAAGAKPLSPPAFSHMIQVKPKPLKLYHAHLIGFDGEHIQFTQRIIEE